MVTRTEIADLVAFDPRDASVLSIFLDLSPERQVQRAYQGTFTGLAQSLESQVPDDQRAAFQADVERVRAFLTEPQQRGLGVAIYSASPRGFWRVVYTPSPIADAASYGPHPRIRPLLNVLDEGERFALAVVDKEKARLFTVQAGKIENERDVADVVPGRHDQGGWSQSRFQRHHDNAVQAHLKNVIEQLEALAETAPYERLIVVGPDEATSKLQSMLPGPLAERLSGTQPGAFFASNAEILKNVSSAAQAVERASELALVDRLIEYAGARGRSTLGIAATLNAVRLGQVETLAVTENLSLPGCECPSCGGLTREERSDCPWCGQQLVPVADVIERALLRTLAASGTVEIVHDDAAARLEGAGDGIGALLRYAPVTTA